MFEWGGGLIGPAAHSMEHYITSVGDAQWASLRTGTLNSDWGERSKKWLESASSESVLMFSCKGLWMITQALGWIIKKVLIGAAGVSLAVSATLLDQLAWLLRQGVLASVEIAGYIKSLFVRILSFLGKAASTVGEITVAFVHWILSSLFTTLQNIAARSLSFIS